MKGQLYFHVLSCNVKRNGCDEMMMVVETLMVMVTMRLTMRMGMGSIMIRPLIAITTMFLTTRRRISTVVLTNVMA